MTLLLSGRNIVPQHAVEIAGGPQPVVQALVTSLVHVAGYARADEAGDVPVVHLIVDAMDHHVEEVAAAYVRRSLAGGPRPIPLFVTARAKRFQRRGQDWENEFLYPSGSLRIHELHARIRMLAYMWGSDFPVDVIRDAVVGSFRMKMQLDETDYHHRSELVEDLQRFSEWDGNGAPPEIRAAPDNEWKPSLEPDEPYAMLFRNAYRQINKDMQVMLELRGDNDNSVDLIQARDRANTVLRKIPKAAGRFVHVLRYARPHVLIIDDEATEIASTLRNLRVGYETDSASLSEIFEFVAEPLSLEGKPPYPPFFDAEEWIRQRVSGAKHPGETLSDLRGADLILLDLSLHQAQESELAGFIMLEKLRNAVPDLPLVIHTGSAELDHIIQAIRNGADWYIRKDGARPYSDLASILNDIGRRPAWNKRARRLEKERVVCNEASLKELARGEYLYIWRSLANDISEGELEVLPFTAGLSGAVTAGIHVYPATKCKREASARPVASFVAKIDRPYVMLSERERFRRLVRPRIGNRAGRIDSEVVYAGANVAGIAYTFSGIHQGQKGDGRKTLLLPLGQFLERMIDNTGFTEVQPVFDELLNDLLQTLHRSAPAGERMEWMEPLFGETRSLRDSHELRLPPLIDIEITGFGDPTAHENSGGVEDSIAGSEVHLEICRVHRTSHDGFMVTFQDGESGRAHLANLTGEIARFLARFRNLRPNRPLSVSGRIVRTREAFYENVSAGLARDLQWLKENKRPNPFPAVPQVLQVFDGIERETLGIIHGDLNLNNVLLDVDSSGAAVRGALWLIDFARTRRDSLAHDFVELEVDLVTRILADAGGVPDTDAMIAFMESLDAGPLFDRKDFDKTAVFVNDACQFIRRAATAAGIPKREYLASLVMYYLLVIKLHQPRPTDTVDAKALQRRRWGLCGASAALRALGAEVVLPPLPPEVRIPVKRRNEDTTSAKSIGSVRLGRETRT